MTLSQEIFSNSSFSIDICTLNFFLTIDLVTGSSYAPFMVFFRYSFFNTSNQSNRIKSNIKNQFSVQTLTSVRSAEIFLGAC